MVYFTEMIVQKLLENGFLYYLTARFSIYIDSDMSERTLKLSFISPTCWKSFVVSGKCYSQYCYSNTTTGDNIQWTDTKIQCTGDTSGDIHTQR